MGGKKQRERKLKKDIKLAKNLRDQLQNETPELNHYIEQKEEKLDNLNVD